jgi:hypothetical protein
VRLPDTWLLAKRGSAMVGLTKSNHSLGFSEKRANVSLTQFAELAGSSEYKTT